MLEECTRRKQRFNLRLRHLIGPYAQAVDTQPNENRGCNWIGSGISANSNGLASLRPGRLN
jgi:hypothetical protein